MRQKTTIFSHRFIRKILDLMLSNIHLILFFDIYNIIKLTKSCQDDVDVHVDLAEARNDGTTLVEREIQTELHLIPCRRDEKYVWNLWDFRRKAIELVKCSLLKNIKNIVDFCVNSRQIYVVKRQLPHKRQCLITNLTLEINSTRSTKKVFKPTQATK